MAFEITTTCEFSASHQLKLYDGSMEPLHGHNWRVRVMVGARQLDGMGVVMDFHELERLVQGIIAGMHNRHLNEVSPFAQGLNPSAENVAWVVGSELKLPEGIKMVNVEVWETTNCSAVWRP